MQCQFAADCRVLDRSDPPQIFHDFQEQHGQETQSTPAEHRLVIVESPAKARTISKFLGRGYTIEASIGHIRDLPQGAKEIPEQYKKEDWAYLGVNVNHDFEPVYVIPHAKSQQVRKLKSLLKGANELYLATDEDREGEAISWHLCEVLQAESARAPAGVPRNHQRSDSRALEHPRQIDEDLVRAQEVRRIVDRLVRLRRFAAVCGGRFARGSRPAGCRAWPCG